MTNLFRVTFRNTGISNVLHQFSGNNELKFARTITSKLLKQERQENESKPKPWPYKEKKYNYFHQFIDKTSARFDENTKVIVVEGPVAAGKSSFAKQLAEDLDMYYMPEANLDMRYINDYGFDLRSLDSQLPEMARTFDVNDFLMNPRSIKSAAFQFNQYIVKYSQYIDALAHVLSTGQGVVLDRCCYSDFVFLEAMHSQGYISKPAKNKYYYMRSLSIQELMRPHLIIYLDVSVPKIQENIQKRAISYEVKSPALTKEYLTEMEKHYKQNYLKEMSKHSELLIYDWSDGGDPEVVVEDIERIDFEYNKFDNQETKFKDWVQYLEEDWAYLRRKYCNQKNYLMELTHHPAFDVPELLLSAEDADERHFAYNNAPGNEYEYGFNKKMGDKNLFFKLFRRYRETLPLRKRRSY